MAHTTGYFTHKACWQHEMGAGHPECPERLDAIEANLAHSPHTGTFCHGDAPTLADICLCSQLLAMFFFKVDASAYPTARRIQAACEQLPAFADAHPLKQPGAPAA